MAKQLELSRIYKPWESPFGAGGQPCSLGAKSYFAKPYHSWERGLNEHTNGLVRQYFPKGTDFSTLSNADAKRIARPTVSETAGANEELGRLECQATGSESRSFISH